MIVWDMNMIPEYCREGVQIMIDRAVAQERAINAELLAACKAIGKAFDTRPIGGFEGIEDWIDAVRMARAATDKAEGLR